MKASIEGIGGRDAGQKRAEIYTYEAEHEVFAMNWSNRPDKKCRLAVGSYKETEDNVVQIITLDEQQQALVSDPGLEFVHGYPPTKIMFTPDKGVNTYHKDMLVTTSDYLRLFEIKNGRTHHVATLNNGGQRLQSKGCEFEAPLTSFDWNDGEPRRVGTSSIDTTCTIWDIEKGVVETQLIAHDKEVNDFAWGGVGVFASVSGDGSVRVFDLRDKEHSTIIFEAPAPSKPLLRLGWNKQDPRYMATIIMDATQVFILDIRFPATPVAELHRHSDCVNALSWAPHSATHICTAGEDAQALIWDLNPGLKDANPDPILAYTAEFPLSQLHWSSQQTDWVAICFANKTQILRV
eukprot:jgi/Botrbrau1/9996/Bobra.0012s0085.1